MRRFSLSVLIDRSQQEVYDFLSDPANLSKWDSDFESAEWTSNSVPAIGSTFRASGKRLASEKPGFFEIVQWDRPNRYSIGYEAEVRGFFKLVMLLLAGTVKRQHEGDLRKVKELMEAGAL